MKRVLVYAPGPDYAQEPAFRIRMLALIEPMARRGFAWEVAVRPRGPWGRIQLARRGRAFHAVILHRKWLGPLEAWLLRRSVTAGGGRIIMDLDDATMLHETVLGWWARRRLERRFVATAGIVDWLCAGNAYLVALVAAARTWRGKARLVPSVVRPEAYPVKAHEATATPRLVWIGSASTLKYLEEAMPALAQAAGRVPGLALTVIADHPPAALTAGALTIAFERWSLPAEAQLLAAADIGIAPMPENAWTLGKCGYKIVQYMAAGLPVVASPVGMNAELVAGENANDVCGSLPPAWENWPDAIAALAGDAAERARLGANGRRRVETEWCVEKVADTWATILR